MDIQKNTRRQREALGFYSMAMVHEFHTGVSLPVVQRKEENNDNATGIGYKKSKVDKLRICPLGADIFFFGLQLGVRGLQWAVHERSTFAMCIRLLHQHELQFVGQHRACGASTQKYTEWVFHRICEYES